VFILYVCTKIPVSASEPRCSIISVHATCLLIDFPIYTIMRTLIIPFNSIQFKSIHYIVVFIHSIIAQLSYFIQFLYHCVSAAYVS